jgi:hypothetical protein
MILDLQIKSQEAAGIATLRDLQKLAASDLSLNGQKVSQISWSKYREERGALETLAHLLGQIDTTSLEYNVAGSLIAAALCALFAKLRSKIASAPKPPPKTPATVIVIQTEGSAPVQIDIATASEQSIAVKIEQVLVASDPKRRDPGKP